MRMKLNGPPQSQVKSRIGFGERIRLARVLGVMSLSFSPGQARVYLVLPHQGRESPMKLGRIAHVSLMRGNCLFELCLQRFTMHLTNINRSGHSAVIFMVYLMCIDVEASYSSMPVTTHGSHDFYWQFLEAAQQTQIYRY